LTTTYGHALAADLVSVKGEDRSQQYAATQELWKWIDAHEKELEIARPYLDRDPPHVASLDGAEYAAKRVRVIAQKGGKANEEAGPRGCPCWHLIARCKRLSPRLIGCERAAQEIAGGVEGD
jgi:hypothetical protein